MSSTQDLVAALKAELKAAGMTYAQLAVHLGLAESSVKRIFARGEMPLSRVDEVLQVLRLDFADLARRIADAQPLREELTLEQEAAVVADRKLLLMTISCLSQWTFEQIVGRYRIEPPECTALLLRLDRLGIIELRPLNRYRLKVAKGFRWRPDGPVMRYFRAHVVDDYFAGGFEGDSELLTLVHGEIGKSLAAGFVDRLRRIGQDFAQQHLADQRLPAEQREAYTLVIGMRSWFFSEFADLRR